MSVEIKNEELDQEEVASVTDADQSAQAADKQAEATAALEEEQQATEELAADEKESELSDELTKEAVLVKEKEALEDRVLRLTAEIQNIQRRQTIERQDAAKYRAQSLATALLPALDNLERALAVEVASEEAQAVKKGVEMVQQSILQAFSDEKIEPIEALGKVFDPNLHQAVQTVPLEEGQEADTIVQELQKGYQLQDRVIRPSMVIVAQ